jgi:uncharacterized Tic20 family protein
MYKWMPPYVLSEEVSVLRHNCWNIVEHWMCVGRAGKTAVNTKVSILVIHVILVLYILCVTMGGSARVQ